MANTMPNAENKPQDLQDDQEKAKHLDDNQVYEALNLLKGIHILSLQKANSTDEKP